MLQYHKNANIEEIWFKPFSKEDKMSVKKGL